MTYEAIASLIEFELKKILLYKLEKSKSYRAVKQYRDLYDALIKSYQLDNDLFDSYGKAYSTKTILDVSSLFGFDQRVSVLEKEISQFKQVDHSAQLLSYTAEFEKKAQEEKDRYIDVIEKSIKASLTEFELKKILLDKLEKSKSYRAVKQHKDLYDALIKSYQLDNDLFDSYGKAYSLKRGRKDKDKYEDPPA
ncbi:hypothetical protein Tco_0526174 [Tanacetum coccineum]